VGGLLWYGSPFTHSISGRNLALQVHLVVLHIQGRSQLGTIFSGELLLKVPAFMRVKHRDFSDEIRSFLISPTALSCHLTLSECICCCLHFSRTWSQVSGSFELHIGHIIEG
jgi:hypothetical protein